MADARSRLLRSAGSMAAMTVLSRLTGYARDFLQAVILGAADSSDAFIIAYRIPNLLRRLVGEGAMTAAFVPVFTEVESRQQRDELWRFASLALSTLAVALVALSALGILFAPGVVKAMAYGFGGVEGKLELTTGLTRVMFPYLFFIGLSALQMAILNATGSFALPAFTPVLLNLSIIAAALGAASRMQEPAYAFAWGVLVGGFLQMAIQIAPLRRAGLRLSFETGFHHPRIRRVLALMFPGAFGAGIYQINLLIDSQFASFLPTGSASYLYYANRITELVLGIFVISISTAILPALSREVQREAGGAAWGTARDTLDFGLRQTALVTLPACAGLLALSEPIVRVLFERGRFDAASTHFTAEALVYYSIGIVPLAALRVILPAFYARQDTRTPTWIAFWTMTLHLVLNALLIWVFPMGHRGIALSTSLCSAFNLAALAWVHSRRWGPAWTSSTNLAIGRCALASLVMAFGCRLALGWLRFNATMGFAQIVVLTLVIAAGVIAYFALLWLLGAPEPRELLAALRRRRSA